MADLEAVTENIEELLTNTINMTSIFYDIFLSTVPMDITLKQYNEDNKIVEVVIPNRAKDRKIALEGIVAPEGVTAANVGACYVDTSTQTVYFKASDDGGTTGWVAASDQASVESYVRNYLTNNKFITENDVAKYLVNNEYIVKSDLEASLASYKPAISMSEAITGGTSSWYAWTKDTVKIYTDTSAPTAEVDVAYSAPYTKLDDGTITAVTETTITVGDVEYTRASDQDILINLVQLTDNEGFYIAPEGSIRFVLPSVSNVNRLHSMLVQINLSDDFISNGYTIDCGTTNYFDHVQPDFSNAGMHNLIYEYDLNTYKWVCGWMAKGVA